MHFSQSLYECLEYIGLEDSTVYSVLCPTCALVRRRPDPHPSSRRLPPRRRRLRLPGPPGLGVRHSHKLIRYLIFFVSPTIFACEGPPEE